MRACARTSRSRPLRERLWLAVLISLFLSSDAYSSLLWKLWQLWKKRVNPSISPQARYIMNMKESLTHSHGHGSQQSRSNVKKASAVLDPGPRTGRSCAANGRMASMIKTAATKLTEARGSVNLVAPDGTELCCKRTDGEHSSV